MYKHLCLAVVMFPNQLTSVDWRAVASSDSSDSAGSPGGVAAFQPEEDLSQVPATGQPQNQGPCLMQ